MYTKQYWRGWRDAVQHPKEDELHELREKLIIEDIIRTREGFIIRQDELEEESDLFLEEDIVEGVV